VKCKAKIVLPVFLSLVLVFTQSGCTYALWTDQDYERFHQPAQTSNLRLFESKKQNDILVVYKEQSEHNEQIHTRAYWLNRNQIRVTRGDNPIFTTEKTDRNLPAVPVFDSMPTNRNAIQSLYALCKTNQSFTLYSVTGEVGSYNLPAYEAKRPVSEKVALTPVALTADVAIAAAVAGVVVLCLWAASQGN
jgi:hypothetical protein